MKRRNFFTGLIGLAVAGTVGKVVGRTEHGTHKTAPVWGRWYKFRQTPDHAGKFGHVDTSDAIRGLCRVWLDGQEVTNDCFEADDQAGYVKLFKRGADGRYYIQHRCSKPDSNVHEWFKNSHGEFVSLHRHCDALAQETRTGKVEIRLRDNLTQTQALTVLEWERDRALAGLQVTLSRWGNPTMRIS